MSDIHPTAIIADSAEIGSGTTIGPYSVIGPKVKIGCNNVIASHVVIEGNTEIGDENKIFQFASVGSQPQDLKYHGEDSRLVIGNKNLIRENTTIQPGTEHGGMLTVVGSSNLFMVGTHVAHDVKMGDHNIMVNNASLAGHTDVADHVIMGANSGYHQYVRLGAYAFICGGTIVTKDVPPYCMAQGERAGLAGINKVGIERGGFTSDDQRGIQNIYREIFLADGTYQQRLEKQQSLEHSPAVQCFVGFLGKSERGVLTPRKGRNG